MPQQGVEQVVVNETGSGLLNPLEKSETTKKKIGTHTHTRAHTHTHTHNALFLCLEKNWVLNTPEAISLISPGHVLSPDKVIPTDTQGMGSQIPQCCSVASQWVFEEEIYSQICQNLPHFSVPRISCTKSLKFQDLQVEKRPVTS